MALLNPRYFACAPFALTPSTATMATRIELGDLAQDRDRSARGVALCSSFRREVREHTSLLSPVYADDGRKNQQEDASVEQNEQQRPYRPPHGQTSRFGPRVRRNDTETAQSEDRRPPRDQADRRPRMSPIGSFVLAPTRLPDLTEDGEAEENVQARDEE